MSITLNSDQTAPVCGQCRQSVRIEEAIRFGDRWVCAHCKPAYLQKLREGEGLEPKLSLPYAGFWIRGAAVFIDTILEYTLGILIAVLCGQSLAEATGFDGNAKFTALDGALLGVGILLDLAYSTLMVGRYGATVGKLVFGLRVVRADGARVSYGVAFGRCLANYLSLLPCLLGYIMAAFDPEKRALHDRVCDTRAIRASKRSNVTN